MSIFRLPDRSVTNDVKVFDREWDKIIIPLEKKLGVLVLSFDPGFTVLDRNDKSATANIPMWLAKRIIE